MFNGPVVELTIRSDWLATLEGVPVMLRSPASVTAPGTVSRVTVVPVFMFTGQRTSRTRG